MLQASNISKHYGDVQVLNNVSFIVNPKERIGLIGPNGCGKSTLLRIISGAEKADSGSAHYDPPSLRIAYLEQALTYAADETLASALHSIDTQAEALEIKIGKLATALASAAGKTQTRLLTEYGEALSALEALPVQETKQHHLDTVLMGLKLAHIAADIPIQHLSGGQKTRLGLARMLIQQPQLLLLDEPTNHLDMEALEWLESWLKTYQGAMLIVSHDRTFLNETVTSILDLDPQTHKTTHYPGNYDDYLRIKQQQLNRQWESYNAQQERIARLQGESRRLSSYASSIEQGTIDFSVRKIAKGIARRATVQRRRIEREISKESVERPQQSWHMKLEFVETPPSGQQVIFLEDLAAGYEGVPLFSEVNQILQQGERVALIGPNGAGKTTLLRVLTGELAPLSGEIRLGSNVKIGYYAQEQENLDPQKTAFDTISETATMSDTELRSFLHYFLFAGDDVFVPVRSLSYGERARLALAKLVASGYNCLLLDEPINHLDIPSRAAFEQAMSAFKGTVLAVVHDRYFIQHFATRIWAVEQGGIQSYINLQDYHRIRQRRQS